MSYATELRGLSRAARWCLIGGVLLPLSAFGSGSWLSGLIGVALLSGVGWTCVFRGSKHPRTRTLAVAAGSARGG